MDDQYIDAKLSKIEWHVVRHLRALRVKHAHGGLWIGFVDGLVTKCEPTSGDDPAMLKEMQAA